jgi:hypothetical protein
MYIERGEKNNRSIYILTHIILNTSSRGRFPRRRIFFGGETYKNGAWYFWGIKVKNEWMKKWHVLYKAKQTTGVNSDASPYYRNKENKREKCHHFVQMKQIAGMKTRILFRNSLSPLEIICFAK